MFAQFAIFVTILQLISAQYGSKCCSSKSNFVPDYDGLLASMDLLQAKMENSFGKMELLYTKLNKKFDYLKASCCSKNGASTEPTPTEPVTAETSSTETTPVEPLSTETTTTETTTTKPSRRYCAEALEKSGKDGVYKITIPNSAIAPFDAYCMNNFDTGIKGKYTKGPWMVIQRRMDGSQDFYKVWRNYQDGFGDLNREFHMGLDKLHALTQSTPHELWIQMEDYNYKEHWAYYSGFSVDSEANWYGLKLGYPFQGSVKDQLQGWDTKKFSTRDNDHSTGYNCMDTYKTAWWLDNCAATNLNGEYGTNMDSNRGIWWKDYNGESKKNVYLKKVHMAIRPKQ